MAITDLEKALVGPHTLLYHTSPFFHAAIRTLGQLLPEMVNGLAQKGGDLQFDDSFNALLVEAKRNINVDPE